MKKVFREFKYFRGHIFALVVFILFNVVSNIFMPKFLADIINFAIPERDMGKVFILGLQMFATSLFSIFTAVCAGYYSSNISVGISRNIRRRIFHKVQKFSEKEFDIVSVPSLITRTNNDVIQVQTFLNFLFKISFMTPFMALGATFMALEKSRELSNVLLLGIPIMVAFILIVGRRTIPISTQMQERLDDMNMVVREKLMGIRVARVFGTQEYEEERFRKVNEKFRQKAESLYNLMIILFPGLHIILYATTIAIMLLGGYEIFEGSSLPVGDVIAMIQYTMQIMFAVVMFSVMLIIYPRASVSMKRINEVLDMDISVRDDNKDRIFDLENMEDDGEVLSFENVDFSFEGAEDKTLENISFSIKRGEKLAIIGSTGSGKSTLIKLIPRFFDVTRGSIKLFNRDIREYSLEQLRKNMGISLQKAFLFKGSVKENLMWGNEGASVEEVYKALEIVNARDFVDENEQGIQREVSQGGSNFSGGQRQRLAMARAILRNPALLIFDDSFSALDFRTEKKVRSSIEENFDNVAILIVAQRVSTIKNADKIMVLDKGKIVGFAKHDQLLRDCEVYKQIVQSQNREEEVAYEK